MSAFGGKADITIAACLLSRSLLGVKQTSLVAAHMSAFDPKRTSPLHCGMSAKADLRKVSYSFRASQPIATIACGHFSFSGSFFGTWPGTYLSMSWPTKPSATTWSSCLPSGKAVSVLNILSSQVCGARHPRLTTPMRTMQDPSGWQAARSAHPSAAARRLEANPQSSGTLRQGLAGVATAAR
jgi:hypothetical protein